MLYQVIMKTLASFGWIAILGFVASFGCYAIDKKERRKRG